jgi:hypothetical protein
MSYYSISTNDTVTVNIKDELYQAMLPFMPPEYMHDIEMALALVGILLNVCHGIALVNMATTWSAHMKLIFSLAVSDMIISALQLVRRFFKFPTLVSATLDFDISSKQLFLSLTYLTTQLAQTATMLGFAVNLFIATKFPLHHGRLMSSSRCNIFLCCFWIGNGFVVVSIYFLCQHLAPFPMEHYSEDVEALIIVYFTVITASTLSAIVLIALYSIVFFMIYKLKRRSPRSILLRKSAITFLSVMITYLVFMMPGTWTLLFAIIIAYNPDMCSPVCLLKFGLNASVILSYLYLLNSICDPFIYFIRLSEIRESYNSIFKKICKRS